LGQGQRNSGCSPGRRTIDGASISSVWVTVYCDYSQSLMAIGFLLIWGRRQTNDNVRRLPAEVDGSSF
jgi:hypothetical protein